MCSGTDAVGAPWPGSSGNRRRRSASSRISGSPSRNASPIGVFGVASIRSQPATSSGAKPKLATSSSASLPSIGSTIMPASAPSISRPSVRIAPYTSSAVRARDSDAVRRCRRAALAIASSASRRAIASQPTSPAMTTLATAKEANRISIAGDATENEWNGRAR